jgi:hypothetical protein
LYKLTFAEHTAAQCNADGTVNTGDGFIGTPFEQNIYPITASPTDLDCVVVTESWVPGQSTFLHEEL